MFVFVIIEFGANQSACAHREAAMNPMCFEDKKALINKINSLPVDKMDRVLEIIRESRSLPAGQDHDEIEVPLDSLDSLTLRKLQQFVEVIALDLCVGVICSHLFDCRKPKRSKRSDLIHQVPI